KAGQEQRSAIAVVDDHAAGGLRQHRLGVARHSGIAVDDLIDSGFEIDDGVPARSRHEHIRAGPAGQPVRATAACKRVVAVAADECVPAGAAVEAVVAVAAGQPVAAGAAGNHVYPIAAADDFAAAGSGHRGRSAGHPDDLEPAHPVTGTERACAKVDLDKERRLDHQRVGAGTAADTAAATRVAKGDEIVAAAAAYRIAAAVGAENIIPAAAAQPRLAEAVVAQGVVAAAAGKRVRARAADDSVVPGPAAEPAARLVERAAAADE